MAMASVLMAVYAGTKTNTRHKDLLATTVINLERPDINPFCNAILQGDIETVERLITLGEDVNKKSLGKTPAMYAARYNKTKILELLIRYDADLSIESDEGFTAEKYAELSHAKESLAVIEASGKG